MFLEHWLMLAGVAVALLILLVAVVQWVKVPDSVVEERGEDRRREKRPGEKEDRRKEGNTI